MTSRIVHLGLGNFHRAHQAVYTDDVGGWEITGVAHRSRQVVEALRQQGMRYTVVTIDGDDVAVREVAAITEALVAATDSTDVVARIADPATRVVSLTVTEAGYGLGPDGGFDLSRDDVRADLAAAPGGAPRTMIALLCRGLAARAAAGGEPVTLLSCDNLPANGEALRTATTAFAAAAGLDLGAYLAGAVGFPSTMVDRIVPATTSHHVELARAAGFDDAVPVPAEPFRQWVLQPRFRAGRPTWEQAGAVFTEDVHAWETVKVRLLNGVHSLIAHLGLLGRHALIADAYADPAVRRAADGLGDEYVPTLSVPAELDLVRYRSDLADRFGNVALAHRTAQVGTDGSLKLLQRVPEPALWHLRRGEVPGHLALLVAAFLRGAARPDAIDAAVTGRPSDPAAARLATLGAAHAQAADLARAVLIDDALFGAELGAHAEFVGRVAELLDVLDRHGPAAAVSAAGSVQL